MADPLSLLRQYCINDKLKEIVVKNGILCFGEYCWPKTVKTNYLIYSSSRDGLNRSYYTLECLHYFLSKISETHPTYVKQAAKLNIPVVQRPDRKDLLAYLTGDIATSASIDRSAPIELPLSVSQLNKDSSFPQGTFVRPTDEDGQTASKIAKLDDVRKQFSAKLDAPKIKKPQLIPGLPSGDTGTTTSLRDALSTDQIAALKAKRLAKKRSTIVDADTDLEADHGSFGSIFAADSNFTKEIFNKERVWRNRVNILQSSGKNFQKTIFPMLQTLKIREDGQSRGKGGLGGSAKTAPASSATSLNSSQASLAPAAPTQQYNRYDQERFAKPDNSIPFRIDTTSTYHGLTLKSVTEGSTKPTVNNSSNQNGSSKSAGANGASAAVANKPQKRVSRTPIIIIPSTNTSLITVYNARSILQDLKYVDSKDCDQKRESNMIIQRHKADNTTVPYSVIDNPIKLSREDWNRVVAVFVQGPAWQFKGWPYDGNPVHIFSRIKGFHLKFDETKLDPNVSKWNVEVINLSRTKRYLDRANLLKLWSQLDLFIKKHKHNIVRY